MEYHENCDSFFDRWRLLLTCIKEYFIFNINISKSSQKSKKKNTINSLSEQNTPVSESQVKTLGSALKAYMRVTGYMSDVSESN